MARKIRAAVVLTVFAVLTLPLMPVQALLLRVSKPFARRLPTWYHRAICRVMGLHLTVQGAVVTDQSVLIVANHASWLDIVVISAIAPVSFVAKKEVASWPFVASLARLQRTVFVDRERRSKIGDTATEITGRLADGDAIVLFAEGTSSDGNRILGFKTSLFAAVKPTGARQNFDARSVVQTLVVAYTRQNGLPLGWAGRRALGYYGDVDMGANAWSVLTGGTLAAKIIISEPVALDSFKDRKALAFWAEQQVRSAFVTALRA